MGKIENKIFDGLVNFIEKQEVFFKIHNTTNYEGLSISEVHCIEKIGKLKHPNAINISKDMNMTRGGVSKLAAKLIKKGYIVRGSIEGNKKEVHYFLTKQGEEIFKKHEKLHEEARVRENKVISTFNSEEQEVISRFIEKMNNHTNKLIEELKE